MRQYFLRIALCISSIAAFTFPAFAIMGVGVHYGYDLSLSMADKIGEQAPLNDLNLDVSKFGTVPNGYTKTFLTGKDLPITIDRKNFERNAFDIGGKIYVDVIPFINVLELSANYGMWQYQGQIKYPTSITFNTASATNEQNIKDIATIKYDSTMVTLKDLGLSNPFLNETPYAKLNFDLTVRKYIVQFPPVLNTVKIYGGLGASLIYATPVLSAGFIDKAIGSTLSNTTDVSNLQSAVFGQNSSAMKTLGNEFFKELFTPHWGAHLDLGAMIKIPIMPVGIYIDGKYMIPFGQLDDNVSELKSTGLLFNAGLAFAL
jgi:hypothetical protein